MIQEASIFGSALLVLFAVIIYCEIVFDD